ncbi:DgyrCDS13520 [Dimorphilus gyrociliatus]|uniref:DgyrCDS13520 n=1 Tax=Dimorphilus gyrociliatus TaxID=2664684 RepID=A0A7I8WAV6_9ANNE|nr:DgyrCDS13520 [Dimorphilus gyrociliatus]
MAEFDPEALKKFFRGLDATKKDDAPPCPTIRPNNSFCPEAAESAARFLHKDLKGLGISLIPVIHVLTNLSNEQRQIVKDKYNDIFNRNLIEDLRDDLLGDFETIVLFLMLPRKEFDAQCVRRALFPNEAQGEDYKEHWLLEILCAGTKDQIIALKDVYNEKFNSQLTDDIAAKTQEKPQLQKLLLALCEADREQIKFKDIDLSLAEADAETIYKLCISIFNPTTSFHTDIYLEISVHFAIWSKQATEGREGTDMDSLIDVFTNRSWAHLREVFSIYKQQREKTPEETIEQDLQNNAKTGLLFLAKFARDRYEYFADRIKEALNGEVDDDESVYRLLIARSEIDLQNIRISFKAKYKKTLVKFIKQEFAGDVQKMLIKILDPFIIL